MPMQPGDVEATYADTSELERYIGFKPKTNINFGIKNLLNGIRIFMRYYDFK